MWWAAHLIRTPWRAGGAAAADDGASVAASAMPTAKALRASTRIAAIVIALRVASVTRA
jgi:hypothetical protein